MEIIYFSPNNQFISANRELMAFHENQSPPWQRADSSKSQVQSLIFRVTEWRLSAHEVLLC